MTATTTSSSVSEKPLIAARTLTGFATPPQQVQSLGAARAGKTYLYIILCVSVPNVKLRNKIGANGPRSLNGRGCPRTGSSPHVSERQPFYHGISTGYTAFPRMPVETKRPRSASGSMGDTASYA